MERAVLERAVYERSVLELFEAIHKEVATSEGTEPIVSEARVRAEQLLAQTAPVTERKHLLLQDRGVSDSGRDAELRNQAETHFPR